MELGDECDGDACRRVMAWPHLHRVPSGWLAGSLLLLMTVWELESLAYPLSPPLPLLLQPHTRPPPISPYSQTILHHSLPHQFSLTPCPLSALQSDTLPSLMPSTTTPPTHSLTSYTAKALYLSHSHISPTVCPELRINPL